MVCVVMTFKESIVHHRNPQQRRHEYHHEVVNARRGHTEGSTLA